MHAIRLYSILLVAVLVSATADSLEAQTITYAPIFTFRGLIYNFGGSVSGAGDVNGDGTPDLIVGAAGSSFISPTGLGSAHVFSGSDGRQLYNFGANVASISFGASVSGVGDVNGDGLADLIVGISSGRDTSGSTRVFSGFDGSVLFDFKGNDPSDRFGSSVSGAGDINGDGTPDLIVGASGDRNNGTLNGSAYVLSGSDGSVLYHFNGNRLSSFGSSVSGAGDVNGDGTPDLIVGARNDNVMSNSNGQGSGSASVLSGSDGSLLYKFDGDNIGDSFGGSVSGIGDVNGDGRADLIVGAVFDDNNGPSSGNARVFSGSDGSVLYSFDGASHDKFGSSVSGLGDVNGDGRADLIVGGSRSAYVLSGSDGSVLHTFHGDNSSDNFGISVSGAGDINGDGIDDFIVGAWGGGYARVFVSQVLGDCNQDGVVNFLDISPFIAILSAGDFLGQADTNEDGEVNFLDISPFIALLSS